MSTSLISLISIPEYRRLILSHIWFKDLREFVLTCKDAKHYVGNDVELLKHLLTIMSFHAHGISLSESSLNFPKEMDAYLDYHNLLRMASRVSAWPLKAVVGLPAKELRRRARYAMQEVNVDGRSCVLFHGDRGRDRAFFSDDHFPVTGQFGNLSRGDEDVLGSSLLPFTKPYIFPASPSSSTSQKSCKCKHSLVLSCISYYEISVLSPMPPDRLPQRPPPNLEPFLPPPCVCIGMARPGFSAFSMQPGWDSNSFAWHCDDGQLYFGDGSDSIPLLQSVDAHYGSGDTVGIGLVHGLSKGSLFFTKNGHLVGFFIPSDSEARELVRYPWFAAVGVDCYCPVACNFGGGHDTTPFQFDVHTFETDLKSFAETDAKLDSLTEKYQLLPVQRNALAKTAALVTEVWQTVRDTPSSVSQASSVSQTSPVSFLMSARQVKLAQSSKQRRISPWFYDLQRPWRHKQLRRVAGVSPLTLVHPSVDDAAVSRFFDERMTKIVKDVVQLQGWLTAAVAFEDLPQRRQLMRFALNGDQVHLPSLFPFLLPSGDEEEEEEEDLAGDEEDDSDDSDSDDNDNDSNGDIYEPIASPAYVSSYGDPGHSATHWSRRDTNRMNDLRHRMINALLPRSLLSVGDTDEPRDTDDTGDEDFEEMDEDDSDVFDYLRGGAREVEHDTRETHEGDDDDTEDGRDTGMDVEQRVFHDELMRILLKRVAGEEEAFQEIDDQDLDTLYHLQLQRQRQRQDDEENQSQLRRLYALDSDSESDLDEEDEEEEEEEQGSGDEVEREVQTDDTYRDTPHNSNNNSNGYEQWMRRMLQRLERQMRGGAEQGREQETETGAETETETETTSSLLRRLRLLPPETILRFLLSQRSDSAANEPETVGDTTANAEVEDTAVSRSSNSRDTNNGDKSVTCPLSLDTIVADQPATKDSSSSSSDILSPPVSAFRSPLTSPVPVRRDTHHDTSHHKVGYERWSDEHLISTALRTSSLRELAQLQQASFLDAIATARHVDVGDDRTHEGEDEEVVRSPKRSRYDN